MRAPDLIAAIEWTRDRLKDFTVLERGLQGVPLSAVNQSDEVGKQIVVAADEVVADAGSASDLIATVPDKHTGNLQSGMFSFSFPVPSQSSPFQCYGVHAWTPIWRTAGCVDVFWKYVRFKSRVAIECHGHAYMASVAVVESAVQSLHSGYSGRTPGG